MPGFRIRRATTKDMHTLVEHRQKMFADMDRSGPEGRGGSDPYAAWARRLMRRKLYHCYIVTSSKGKVAASGGVWLREVQPSRGQPATKVPYLVSMYTVPEFRRKGLASMIVKEAMRWARRRGYHRMSLHASSKGRKVYSKLGWKRTWEMRVELG